MDNETPAASTAPLQHAPRVIGRPFAPGQSGNPAGRKKGSRNKLTDDCIRVLQEDFEKHGAAAVETMRLTEPAQYVKAIVSLMPKDVHINASPLHELTDDELLARIEAVRRWTDAGAPAIGDGQTYEGEASLVVQGIPEAA
jgi:hypothetical protein